MSKDTKKNYYKKNNNYIPRKKQKTKQDIVSKKHITYDELINGHDGEREYFEELPLSNNNKLIYIKYVGTIIILILIVIASIIFFKLS